MKIVPQGMSTITPISPSSNILCETMSYRFQLGAGKHDHPKRVVSHSRMWQRRSSLPDFHSVQLLDRKRRQPQFECSIESQTNAKRCSCSLNLASSVIPERDKFTSMFFSPPSTVLPHRELKTNSFSRHPTFFSKRSDLLQSWNGKIPDSYVRYGEMNSLASRKRRMSLPTELGIKINFPNYSRALENPQSSRIRSISSTYVNFQSELKNRKFSQGSLSSISFSSRSEEFDPQSNLPLLSIPQKEKCIAFTANDRLKTEAQFLRDRKDSVRSISSNSSRSLSKAERFLGEDIKTLNSTLKCTSRPSSPSETANEIFSEVGEYSTVISSLRKFQGSKCVAKAELRFYVNAKHEEYQDSPVDILMTRESIQVLLLRQSYSRKKSRPKWKPLLFNLTPNPELGLEGIKRSTYGGESCYTVDFTRNTKGYPMGFAKNVLEINNWSSNSLYNRFKKKWQ
mmetsp:Transcript_349/g.522  ORF Transcript_349/g.522 Transcript_349/m.522 type:complete len:454 (-) Transcript_349:3-1364(-)